MKRFTLTLGILATTLTTTAGVIAHDLVSINGQGAAHQHVNRSGQYGSTPRQGHYAKPPGSNGIVIFSAKQSGSYGRQVPLNDFQQKFAQQRNKTNPLQQQFEEEAAKDSFGSSRKK